MTQVSRAGNKNGTEESRHKKKLNRKAKMSCTWHMAGGCKEWWFLAMSGGNAKILLLWKWAIRSMVGTKFHCSIASAGITKSDQRYKA
jgi:hypothetical protein